MDKTLITYLTLIQVKHFVADWWLQTNYMVNGKRRKYGWFFPLLLHSGLHAWLTFVVVKIVTGDSFAAVSAMFFDLIVHTVIDRLKSTPRLSHMWDNPAEKIYWVVMGFDQFLHQVTYLVIYYLFVEGK